MKRTMFTAAAALVISPALLLAQASAAPAPTPAGLVITQTMHTSGTLYAGWLTAAFDSIPASKYGFKPTPVQQTVGYVAQHLEEANYLLCSRFGGMPWLKTAKDSLADTVKALWPKDTLTARLKASFAYCDKAFAVVTDANLTDSLSVGTPAAPRKVVRVRAVLIFVLDLVDHYSQIANYMRLNGMVPPSSFPKLK